jgi:mRNA-degrading endonuclease RelE of RelBE toxin-antitoxin system
VSALVIELTPRALRELQYLPPQDADAILEDFEILRTLPWPGPPKVKRLQGTSYLRLRTGGFRSMFIREGQKVIVLRVVARKDLERVLKGFS